jgi:CRP/FNR family transcriptional regulator
MKLFQVAPNGKEMIVELVSPGGVLGDMATADHGERTAFASAIEDVLLVHTAWEEFERLLHRSPELAAAVAELMADRLKRLHEAVMSLVTKPVSARLAGALVRSSQGGEVRHGLTHQELAQTIGTSRETVTALLNRFVSDGIIVPAPSGFILADAERLAAIAEGQVAVSSRYPAGIAARGSAAS